MEFVHAFTAKNEIEAALIKGRLENEGIPVTTIPRTKMFGSKMSMGRTEQNIMVPLERVEETKTILKNPDPDLAKEHPHL